VDLDQSANTISFNVISLNDAPARTEKPNSSKDVTSHAFAASDFGFTDPNDSPANTLQAVKITTTVQAGTLKLSGADVTGGQSISAANIPNLVFAPAANANGNSYASLTFQVQDNGGTTGGGVDLDQSANTITFNVTSVNDAPAGTDNTVTTLEDTDYVFAAANFGFSDPQDAGSTAGANALQAVRITTLPGAGTLAVTGGPALSAGDEVSAADINVGKLKFSPAANANG